jgi:curved DNA-binding protein CbpA
MPDYYEILGVPRNASTAEVRKAYSLMARERHPDRFSDPEQKRQAEEFFKMATAAFNALSSEKGRQEYEQSLARPRLTTPEEISQDAYEKGLQYFEARQYHEAVELMRTAVFHGAENPLYHAGLGLALGRNPHWAREAIQSLEKAVQLAPRTASFHGLLAELLLAQGLRLRARKTAETALAYDPREARALRVLEDLGDTDEPPAGGGLKGLLRRKP